MRAIRHTSPVASSSAVGRQPNRCQLCEAERRAQSPPSAPSSVCCRPPAASSSSPPSSCCLTTEPEPESEWLRAALELRAPDEPQKASAGSCRPPVAYGAASEWARAAPAALPLSRPSYMRATCASLRNRRPLRNANAPARPPPAPLRCAARALHPHHQRQQPSSPPPSGRTPVSSQQH